MFVCSDSGLLQQAIRILTVCGADWPPAGTPPLAGAVAGLAAGAAAPPPQAASSDAPAQPSPAPTATRSTERRDARRSDCQRSLLCPLSSRSMLGIPLSLS